MSTRYVWERYSAVDVPSGTYEEKRSDELGSYDTTRVNGFPRTAWTGCTAKPTGPDANGCYAPAGQTLVSGSFGGATAIKQSEYQYFMVNDSVENRRRYYYNLGSYNARWILSQRSSSDADAYVELLGISNQQRYAIYIVEAVEGTKKGPGVLQGKSASASSAAYPANGLGGSYWYKYLGADSIDPTGISYANTAPKGGETVTVTVTPRGNTYGGTVSYQYQYSTNGGASWANSGDPTTSLSKAIPIPRGATQFQARVVASDNYGFTSTTYVAGANLAVANLRAYVGINGRARAVGKLYVGVNGKAREVVKGYVGDANGKARVWF